MFAKKMMSLTLASVVAASLPLQAFAADYKLQEGQVVRVRLMQALSSKTSVSGESIRFQVVEDILGEDKKTVLVKSGSEVVGTITRVEKNGGVGKPGDLGLTIDYTKAVDGTKVPLRAMMNEEGRGKRGSAIALGVVTGLIFLPGFLFLMKKGKNAEIPIGSELNAYVASNTTVSTAEGVTADAAPTIETGAEPAYVHELEALNDLKTRGLITNEEFEAKKKQLLGL